MSKAPAFQFYVNDWLSSPKITLMTPAEEGAYIRLLAFCWANDGLPDDDEQLARLSRLGEGWFKGGSTKIRNCFILVDGKLHNKRLIKEKENQIAWREKSKRGGELSAKARRKKALQNLKGGSSLVDVCLQPKANSSSSTPTPTSYIVKYNNNSESTTGKGKQKVVSCLSQKEILELDLLIAKKKKLFVEELAKIFPANKRESVTFARIALHITTLAQSDHKKISLFDDAIKWAKDAKMSTAANKKGLWVAKVKSATGFGKQNDLMGKISEGRK